MTVALIFVGILAFCVALMLWVSDAAPPLINLALGLIGVGLLAWVLIGLHQARLDFDRACEARGGVPVHLRHQSALCLSQEFMR